MCRRVGIIDHGRLLACDTLEGLLHSLRGLIRFRVGSEPASLEASLGQLAGCTFVRRGDDLELECDDVKATLLRLIALLNEQRVDLAYGDDGAEPGARVLAGWIVAARRSVAPPSGRRGGAGPNGARSIAPSTRLQASSCP